MSKALQSCGPTKPGAATSTGLLRSGDGAATFQPVTGAPTAAAVEQPEPGRLIVLGTDGRILTARDGIWQHTGTLPRVASPPC
ncbi:hypothetical protein ACFWFZ_14070 [Streptomyces sp. NPDC060232]|uniref:hypothetical protein n=1 Tax=Streptomyces sp. NPDC060232 TaxID=3347079 RepID=UPI003650E3B2